MKLLAEHCQRMRKLLVEKHKSMLNVSICERSVEADSLQMSPSGQKLRDSSASPN